MDGTRALDRKSRVDLIVTGARILARGLGLVVPTGGAAVGAITDVIRERRAKRHAARLELLLEHLGRRMTAIEGDSKQEPVDLLDEIIAQAVSDEDAEKMQYYAGLIDYTMAAKPNPYHVRILGNALRQMTRADIVAFLYFSGHNSLPHQLPDVLKDSFWLRIGPLGIVNTAGGAKHSDSITQFGRDLLRVLAAPAKEG